MHPAEIPAVRQCPSWLPGTSASGGSSCAFLDAQLLTNASADGLQVSDGLAFVVVVLARRIGRPQLRRQAML